MSGEDWPSLRPLTPAGRWLLLSVAFALILYGLLCAPARAAELPSSYQAHVIRVIDGDTVVVARAIDTEPRHVRLVGVDAPEIRHGAVCVSVSPCGCEATVALRELLPNGAAVFVQVTGRDRYGRDLGFVWRPLLSPEGTIAPAPSRYVLANLALVAIGLARVEYRWPFEWRNEFAAAERSALYRKLGVWSRHGDACEPIPAPRAIGG